MENLATVEILLEESEIAPICPEGTLIGLDVLLDIVLTDVGGQEFLARLGRSDDVCGLVQVLDIASLMGARKEVLNTDELDVAETKVRDELAELSVVPESGAVGDSEQF